MLLTGYTKEIFRAECNSSFQSLHCFAHLDEDITEVLPYLNTALGGTGYTREPPSVMFKIHGRLIAVHSRKIAINALKDAGEADKILEWLQREINAAWERRFEIEPSYGAAPRPQVLEILRRLPKTNCRQCGRPTCIVFASLLAEGAKGVGDCPVLDGHNRTGLMEYLGRFRFDL